MFGDIAAMMTISSPVHFYQPHPRRQTELVLASYEFSHPGGLVRCFV